MAASGFAGLSYEVLWTRMLSVALGTELMAALGVVAGFFAGLGLGALVLDGPIRRARSPARAFAMLEGAIGAWAVASVWLLPSLGRALPGWLGESPGPPLLWLAGFAAPAIVLLPATFAMGGTLIALERLVAALRHDGRVAGLVYALNTAGAMAGALGSALLLMPLLGLSGSLLVLAGVNAACAAGALLIGRESAAREGSPTGGVPFRLTAALVCTGLLGIAFEMLVVRLAAQVLQNTMLSFAFLLAAYLMGTALGGLAWQRRAPTDELPPWLPGLVAGTCLVTAALVQGLGQLAVQVGPAFGPWAELGVACLLLLPPAAAMGALFAALAQRVRDCRGSLGWAVGVNSLGAMVAPPLAALVLMPGLGAWPALLIVALGFAALGLPRREGWRPALAVACGAGLLWRLPAPALTRIPPGGTLIDIREGATATASVVEGADSTRYLEVNGHFRMGGTRSVRSDWRQALVPLLLHPAPGRALFLGVGTGATLVGAGAWPGLDALGIELTPEVVALLPWFAERGAPPLPPIIQADARRFVAASPQSWDVIVADLFHPALDGTGSLYTTEHFLAVRTRLAPGGVFCQWLPLYQLQDRSLRAILRSFLDVYPGATAWLANFSVQTPMLAVCGGPARPGLAALQSRLDQAASRTALRRVGLNTSRDVLGLFVADAAALRAYAGSGPRNTDDRPVVALDAARNVRALSAPPAALLLEVLRGLPPDPDDPLFPHLSARNRFIDAGATVPEGIGGAALIRAATPGLLRAIAADPEFEPAYEPLMEMARALLASDPRAARLLLHQIVTAAPSRAEARALLARLPPV